ncbi:MAG: sigma-70 family RNA polymerase sigma factor [Chloroflexi bacterium]|nr:sigma-70 family RNA polymerase sigma factor [Chloroflexota bacterium]
MHPPPNERELIERTKNGDKQAMSVLYETYVQQIFQYISYRVPSEAIAEDLTADVFVRMIQGLSKYQYTGAPLGAWLFRVAANRIADHYRENQPASASSTIEENLTTSDELGELFDKKEEQSQLLAALHMLSEDYQNVLILRFVKDLSHAEAADIMGKTEGAVRILQHRALKALGTAVAGLTEGRGGHDG